MLIPTFTQKGEITLLIILLIITVALLYYVANVKKLIKTKKIDTYHKLFTVIVIIINILFLIVTTLLIWLSAAFSPLTGEEFYRHNALRFLYFSQNALLWVVFIEYKRTGIAVYSKYFTLIVSSLVLFSIFGLPFSALIKAGILFGLILIQMVLYRLSIKNISF